MFAFFVMPGFIELSVIAMIGIISVLPFWLIFQKAGYPGALSLLMLIPVVHIVLIFFLAFADWPALRQREEDGSMSDRS